MRLLRSTPARHAGPRPRRVVHALPRPRGAVRPLRSHLAHAGVRTLARTVVVAAVLVSLAGAGPPAELPADLPTGPLETAPTSPGQTELMKRFDCSPDGFGDGTTPRSAIIREDGDLRVVSFDRGWQVYTGDRPHALVALCHAPPRGAPR